MTEKEIKDNLVKDYWFKKITANVQLIKTDPSPEKVGEIVCVDFELNNQLFEKVKAFTNAADLAEFTFYFCCFQSAILRFVGVHEFLITSFYPKQNDDDPLIFFKRVISGEQSFVDALNFSIQEVKDSLTFGTCNVLKLLDEVQIPLREILKYGFGHDKVTQDFSDHSGVSLHLQVNSVENRRYFTVYYDNAVYDHSWVEFFIITLKNIIDGSLNYPNTAIENLDILSNYDQDLILERFNNTNTQCQPDKAVQQLFEEQADQKPQATCFIFDDKCFTYEEVNLLSNQLANFIRSEYDIHPDDKIAIILNRSPEMIIAILGILKAGAAYLPIDPDFPKERIDFMITDSCAKMLITQKEIANEFGLTSVPIFEINGYQEVLLKYKTSAPVLINKPNDLAYIIYTSGSTGTPKGVMVEHSGLINRISWMWSHYSFNERDIFFQKTPYVFDVSIWEIFMPLCFGAKFIGCQKDVIDKPSEIVKVINRYGVTAIHFVPSFYNVFLDSLRPTDTLASLRHVITSGEELLRNVVHKHYSKSKVLLHNLYGPTEASVDVSYYQTTGEEYSTIPIGRPIWNIQLYILDKNKRLLPPFCEGEICIGGIGLARGYLNRLDLTLEKFVDNPFKIGQRIYLTGDMGRWLPNGNIEFLGRRDNQVKIRGYRIEIGEIENVMLSHPSIKDVSVLAVGDDEKNLTAFYTGEILSNSQLVGFIGRLLPSYMIPSLFYKIDKFPITATGKVDKNKLQGILDGKVTPSIRKVRNELDQRIQEVFIKILKIKFINLDDNFFVIGGDSIKAIRLVNLVNKELHYALDVKTFFLYNTVLALSDYIKGNPVIPKIDNENFKLLKGEMGISDHTVLPETLQDIYPMTDIQVGMVYHYNESGNSVYHEQFSYQIEDSDFNIDSFQEAMALMVQKHEILRTSFHIYDFDQPLQIVHEKLDGWSIELLDLGELSHEEQKQWLNTYLLKDRNNAFEIKNPGIWRMTLFRLGDHKLSIIWSFHHAILDGWSNASFIAELYQLYLSIRTGKRPDVPKLFCSYKNYVVDQIVTNQDSKLKDFWRTELIDCGKTALPFRRTAVQGKRESSGNYFYFSTLLSGQIKFLCSELNIGIKTLGLAAYLYLLRLTTGENNLLIGLVTNNRPELEDGDKVLGCFLNTIPFRYTITDLVSPRQLIISVEEKLQLLKNFEKLSLGEITKLTRDKYQTQSLFDVIFNYNHFHILDEIGDNSNYVEPIISSYENTDTQFDFSLINESDRIGIYINSALYDDQEIQRISDYYTGILQRFVTDSNSPLLNNKILSSSEVNFLLTVNDFSDSKVFSQHTIVDLFEHQVDSCPDGIALDDLNCLLSYKQLNRISNQVAHYLIENNFGGRERLVGLLMNRSMFAIPAMIGILKSGAAYLPIDPSYPEAKINTLLHDANVTLIIKEDYLFLKCDTKTQIITVSEILQLSTNTANPSVNRSPADLAYVIYTSGSTGNPKGVMIEHRNLTRLFFNESFQFNFVKEDIWTLFHSLSFDFSVWEIFGCLLYGGKLVIVPKSIAQSTFQFLQLLLDKKVTVLNQTPSIFNLLSTELLEMGDLISDVPLRYIIFGGEALNPRALKEFSNKFPEVNLINMYGITETTVHATYKEIKGHDIELGINTIGRPIPTLGIKILDDNLQVCPIGTIGEIVVCGEGVGRGYLNNEGLTKEKFIPDLQNDGKLMYRSGDLGLLLPNYEILYAGRKDSQLKLRGFRIEPGEIEVRLCQIEGINKALVRINNEFGTSFLVAYYEGDNEDGESELREKLQVTLPDYMIPNIFVRMKKFPLSANGKIDVKQLSSYKIGNVEKEGRVAPASPLERKLAGIWQKVLRIDVSSVTQNFFELGGHSLSATRLVSEIFKDFSVKLTIKDIFNNITIQQQAKVIENSRRDLFESIPIVKPRDSYELTANQRRLWILQQLEPSNSYTIQTVFLLKGALNVDVLKAAYGLLVIRHESLRSVFNLDKTGGVLQRFLKADSDLFKLETINTDCSFDDADIEHVIRDLINVSFDFVEGPLIKTTLLRQGMEEHILVFVLHHIICDGWSIEVLVHEFKSIYENLILGQRVRLPDLPIQFKDYSAWLNRQHSSKEFQLHRHFWLRHFQESETIPTLDFPTDFKRKPVKTFNGSYLKKDISSDIVKEIKVLLSSEHSSIFSVLLAGLKLLIYKYSSQKDIIVGLPTAGRSHPDTENQIGFYVNTIALRTVINGEETVERFLKRFQSNLLEAMEHDMYPFDQLINDLKIERDPSRSPLFDIMAVFQNKLFARAEIGQIDSVVVESYEIVTAVSRYDLTFNFIEGDDSISLLIEYNTDLFKAGFIERMISHYENILHFITNNKSSTLKDIEYLNSYEIKELLQLAGFDHLSDLHLQTSIKLFESQAVKTPENIAVQYFDKRYSFRELNSICNYLGGMLRNQYGLVANNLIAIFMDRSENSIIGILTILKSGAAYVPIDTSCPEERIRFIIKDAGIKCLITEKKYESFLTNIPIEKIYIDVQLQFAKPVSANLSCINSPDDLMYVIYTSGSTGVPKGVMITHEGQINMTYAQIETFKINGDDCVGQFASLAFDASVSEIFTSFYSGAKLLVIDRNVITDHIAFSEYIAKHKTTVLTIPPAYLHFITAANLTYLRVLITAGDRANKERISEIFPFVQIFNAYGPTESSVCATIYKISEVQLSDNVPIGRPIANMKIYLLDEDLKLVPLGHRGEICISGIGLAKGYVNINNLNEEKFINNSFEEGTKLYRTGDYGRWLEDGNLEYIGRIDSQVKIRGYRVEIGEIENMLKGFYGIIDATVIWDSRASELYAYYVSYTAHSNVEIIAYLRTCLPDYMIPARIMRLESFPLNSSNKIDKNKLPAPQDEIQEVVSADLTHFELELLTIWSEVLDKKNITVNSNFFDLGGHSLKATQLFSRLYKEIGFRGSLVDIYSWPTIRLLAERIETSKKTKYKPIEIVPVSDYYQLSNSQKRLWLVCKSGQANIAYNIQLSYLIKSSLIIPFLELALQNIVKKYEVLRTIFVEIEGRPMQKIVGDLDLLVNVVSLQNEANTIEKVKIISEQEVNHIFDLEYGPLLKATVIVLEKDFVFLLTMHHIISDGWSIEILLKELLHNYNGLLLGKELSDEGVKIQFKDFASWQDINLKSEIGRDMEKYWISRLSGFNAIIDLPYDYNRPKVKSYNGDNLGFSVSMEATRDLRNVCNSFDCNLFMLISASLVILLNKIGSNNDLVLGIPVSGRNHVDLENQIGFFSNTIALRVQTEPDYSTSRIILLLKELIHADFEFQDYPFDLLVDKLNLPSFRDRSPLFDVGFTWHETLFDLETDNPDFQVEELKNDFNSAKTDLWFHAQEINNQLFFSLDYNTDLFSEKTGNIITERLQILLYSLSNNLDLSIGLIDLSIPAEKMLDSNKINIELDI